MNIEKSEPTGEEPIVEVVKLKEAGDDIKAADVSANLLENLEGEEEISNRDDFDKKWFLLVVLNEGIKVATSDKKLAREIEHQKWTLALKGELEGEGEKDPNSIITFQAIVGGSKPKNWQKVRFDSAKASVVSKMIDRFNEKKQSSKLKDE